MEWLSEVPKEEHVLEKGRGLRMEREAGGEIQHNQDDSVGVEGWAGSRVGLQVQRVDLRLEVGEEKWVELEMIGQLDVPEMVQTASRVELRAWQES